MRNISALLVSAISVTIILTGPADARLWKDKSGEYVLEAEFVKIDDGKVSLRKENGDVIEVFLSQLSHPDRNYVEAISTRKKRREPMSKEEAVQFCKDRAVDIEIRGRDAQGAWISHGAGSILHEDGYILTCEHITAIGETQNLSLADGTVYPFTVLARGGHSYDLAVLKFTPDKELNAVELGHSDTVPVGQKVVIVGNPGGRNHTVNHGYIDRIDAGGGTQYQVRQANVNPGDSGGPVFNLRGEQIAHVHVKIYDFSRHVHVDHERDAFEKIFMDEKKYEYAIGIQVDCQSDRAVVSGVKKESPAAKAGIQAGDVITRFGTMRIGNGVHYVLAMMDRVSAEPVTLEFERAGKKFKKEIQPVAVKNK